jgi:hypothetical protein
MKMKIKFNWGTGIFIAIVLFMTFILTFVYKSFSEKYRHELVSEDYYGDELRYQEEIDKLNNALKLNEDISLHVSNKGITIVFPEDIDFNKIFGIISFQRLSNKKLDFNQEINLKSHTVLIPENKLVLGKWEVKIDWLYEDEKYLLKESIFY